MQAISLNLMKVIVLSAQLDVFSVGMLIHAQHVKMDTLYKEVFVKRILLTPSFQCLGYASSVYVQVSYS